MNRKSISSPMDPMVSWWLWDLGICFLVKFEGVGGCWVWHHHHQQQFPMWAMKNALAACLFVSGIIPPSHMGIMISQSKHLYHHDGKLIIFFSLGSCVKLPDFLIFHGFLAAWRSWKFPQIPRMLRWQWTALIPTVLTMYLRWAVWDLTPKR